MILADTNGLIWLAADDPRLGPQARAALEQARVERNLAVSVISFWELAMLRSKGRLPQAVDPSGLLSEFRSAGVTILRITPEICIRAGFIEGLRGDPADRIIVATALEGHQLLTSDRAILNWPGPLQTIPANR